MIGLCALISGIGARPGPVGPVQRREPGEPRSLSVIDSRTQFEMLSRTYYRGRFYALPHVMFVIDRQQRDRVYYINSKLFQFHKDFVNATYLSLERGRAFYENNYLNANRRFILGTIALAANDRFIFEFWEGDRLTPELLAETYSSLRHSFFAPLVFKPNSTEQQQTAQSQKPAIPILTLEQLSAEATYQPLNLGSAIGQLRIVSRLTPDTVIDRNQIVIFKEPPIQLTPLSGIIVTEPASPLSHANLLAKSWGIPNARIKDADTLFKKLEGKYVRLEIGEHEYHLEPADTKDVTERNRRWIKQAGTLTPPADLVYARLTDLKQQRARDVVRFGAKSANLGEIINAHRPSLLVPDGFTIPFRCYKDFIKSNGLEERIAAAVEEDRFVHDPVFRKARLADVREWIQNGKLAEGLSRSVIAKTRLSASGAGVFVRSSTNAEDLPNFSGAGLYTTVPNVRTNEQLLEAIKTVWASVWNYEAYEARESFGMNHFGVYPAVLIQRAVDAESAGVAITTDPFDPANRKAIYLNAKRGLGIKVVEGRRVAEQVLFMPDSGAIQVLTRSGEDTMLVLDEHGGVKERAIEGSRVVLSDSMVRRLASAAIALKQVFKGKDQDIEWAFDKHHLYIVQSRPFVR